ncbi:MAG: SurA N-terminal domain-containing protein, partial [Gammaproteobacteria bacterium]|nr:SurA N-terminal domain-containing protein [Gammaproteobacteria bacterium]
MLQNMREKMQGLIAGTIVFIICLTFALWGIQYYLRDRGNLDVAAKVNGVKISAQQLANSYNRARRIVMAKMGKDFVFDQAVQIKLKAQTLQQLITSTVLYQAALKYGFYISDKQLDAVLTQLPLFQEQGHFSASRFQQMLSNLLYSTNGFMVDLRQRVIINQLQTGVIGSAFALPTETNNLVKLIKQTRDIGYAIIPASHFNSEVKISPQDIKGYYAQHQDDFKTEEQVSIEYLDLSASQLQKNTQVTAQELQQFYDNNIDLYSHPERWQVARVSVALPENATSSDIKAASVKAVALAKSGQFSKPSWIIKDQVASNFVVALQQSKPGQETAPLTTQDGVYILKLLQKKPAEVEPFATVKTEVKKGFLQQRTAKLFADANNKLSDLTYTNSETLEPAAKALHLPLKTTQLFTSKGSKTGLLANPKVLKAAFSDAVLKQSYNSDPIEIGPGEVIVLRIKQHKPAAAKPLTEVSGAIKQQLLTEKTGQKAEQMGKKLQIAAEQGKFLPKLIARNGLAWNKVTKAGRQQSKLGPQIVKAAFSLPAPEHNTPSTTGVK